jgi:hypothetical protein
LRAKRSNRSEAELNGVNPEKMTFKDLNIKLLSRFAPRNDVLLAFMLKQNLQK